MLREDLCVDYEDVYIQQWNTQELPRQQDNRLQRLLGQLNDVQLVVQSLDELDGWDVEQLRDNSMHIHLYNYIRVHTNSYIINRVIRLIGRIIQRSCDVEFTRIVYDDIMFNLFKQNKIALQLLQVSQFEYPPVNVEFLLAIPHGVSADYKWIKQQTIQYSSILPTILRYSDGNSDIILYLNSMFNKQDIKYEVEWMYYKGVLLNKQELLINDDQQYIINGISFNKLIDSYAYTASNGNIKTYLCKSLASMGMVHSVLLELSHRLKPNRNNIDMMLYDCIVFEKTIGWSEQVLSRSWLQGMVQLCCDNSNKVLPLFHQMMLQIYTALQVQSLTQVQLDLLLIRLDQYYETSQLTNKKRPKIVLKSVTVYKPTKPIQKTGKPQGVGYGGVYNKNATELPKIVKQEQNYYESDTIYQNANELKWSIVAQLLRNLKAIDITMREQLEQSSLVVVLINLLSSLNTIESKVDAFQQALGILDMLLNNDLLEYFTTLDYTDTTIFQVIQQVSIEAVYCEKATDKDEIKQLMKRIQQIHQIIESKLELEGYVVSTYQDTVSTSTKQVDGLYPIIMKPLILATSDIIQSKRWLNQMEACYTGLAKVPPHIKVSTLVKELNTLAESLPVQVTNSIFVRYDKERMDAQQVLIMGSSGTPYAHGAFLYNLLFGDDYPQRPPKCLLETTGHGKVRFNPNLYNCGKVCLSLLGTWGDNWVAGQSTYLQILISIQSMVMSEYVYFNEPGWESSMGTPEGEANNRGYCNIVKMCNIRYAMIEQLQNPPIGFEEVIPKSFYLRKDAILTEVEQWLKEVDLPTSYQGTQNHSLSSPFVSEPQKFKVILKAEIDKLKVELDKLKISISQNPSDQKKVVSINHKRRSQYQMRKAQQQAKLKCKQSLQELIDTPIDVVDVSEQHVEQKMFDTNSADVQNLMSRYIGVMGLESVMKQSQASVLLYGLNALGIEVAKNMTLSGLQRLTILDSQYDNTCGQFFAQGCNTSSRLAQSIHHLRSLNPYVIVDSVDSIDSALKFIQNYQVICLCEIPSLEVIDQISTLCRQHHVKLIVSDINSVYARVFVDLGDEFIVIDKDGEALEEIVIESLDLNGIVTTKMKHHLQDNDIIQFREIIQSESNAMDLNTQFMIKVINRSQFSIGDISQFNKYIQNGRGITVKQKQSIHFKPMSEILRHPEYDTNFILDIPKYTELNQNLNKYIQYRQQHGEPLQYNQAVELSQLIPPQLAYSVIGIFPPQAAFIGGVVCQEILKAITHKYMPIRQCYIHSIEEILNQQDIEQIYQSESTKYRRIEILIGTTLLKQISECKLFMVGAGAIGCELLKNYAMLGLGRNGRIILTDPDIIEKSNLSRQFLFREKHIRKPKSMTAANVCLTMNPELKITARLDRVGTQTEETYSNSFFQYIDIVTNALDNVQARLYVDQRCVQNAKPLIESGTLGPKGHVQVILPNLTESYASKQDPQEDNDIPYCTLKMFPEDTNHCLEWARDKFEKIFNLKLQQVIQCLEFKDPSIELLELTIKFHKRRPRCFKDCLQFAANKFQKFFNHNIQQLLKAYPLDSLVNGKPFWSSPKRPPQVMTYKADANQLQFITTTAVLYAQANGIEIIGDCNDLIQELEFKEFAIDETKLKQIQQEVEKQAQQQEQIEQQASQRDLMLEILKLYPEHYSYDATAELLNIKIIKQIQGLPIPIQFEKDQDDNHHISFIQAATNCRALNYGLEQLDWLQTKLKAGRIVPAMASTTASIAGLQTIEVIKVIKQLPLDKSLNTFLNLAIPYCLSSEPGECEYTKINEIKTSFWTRWNIELCESTNTLQKFMNHIKDKYGMEVSSVKQNAKLIYLPLMFIGKSDVERFRYVNQPILLLLEFQDYDEYVELDVNLLDQDGEEVKNAPKVRFILSL